MKRILEVLVLLPIAVVALALAIANRSSVTVFFDPFPSPNAAGIAAPLFVILIAAIILGVILGSFATWLAQGKHRRALRESRAEAARLRGQVGHS